MTQAAKIKLTYLYPGRTSGEDGAFFCVAGFKSQEPVFLNFEMLEEKLSLMANSQYKDAVVYKNYTIDGDEVKRALGEFYVSLGIDFENAVKADGKPDCVSFKFQNLEVADDGHIWAVFTNKDDKIHLNEEDVRDFLRSAAYSDGRLYGDEDLLKALAGFDAEKQRQKEALMKKFTGPVASR